MKPYPWSGTGLLLLVLVLDPVAANASPPADRVDFDTRAFSEVQNIRPPTVWVDRDPVLTVFDPEKDRDIPDHAHRPVVANRDAALPDPANGWELVDRAVAHDIQVQPTVPQATAVPHPQQIFHRLRGPNVVLPVASGM